MKIKLPIILILTLLIAFNFYSSYTSPDKYTQSKINFSSFIGSTSYLGRLVFWRLLVQNGDWDNAASLEKKLNQNQVADYKLNHQPEQLKKKITQSEINDQKNADDYIELARNQSLLGLNQQAIDSIKKAHQLDPIRSDIDKLFYSTK
jgi:cell shape-determining protein MreC